jgi:hypothetical protein
MDRREMPAHLSLRVSGFLVVKRDLVHETRGLQGIADFVQGNGIFILENFGPISYLRVGEVWATNHQHLRDPVALGFITKAKDYPAETKLNSLS